jgi:uncharacterized protein YcfJ
MALMMDILGKVGGSVLGEFAGTFFNGGGGGGGKGSSAASAAALTKIGFATEKEVAMNMAARAEQRGATRKHAEQEGRKEQSTYSQEIARIYQQAITKSVRSALIEQLNRQGHFDNAAAIKMAYDKSEEPTLEPTKIG